MTPVIAGDGLGRQVMPKGLRVIDVAVRKFGVDPHSDDVDFLSWNYFEKHGKMLSDDRKDQIEFWLQLKMCLRPQSGAISTPDLGGTESTVAPWPRWLMPLDRLLASPAGIRPSCKNQFKLPGSAELYKMKNRLELRSLT